MVADLLGCGNVIARSVNLQIKDKTTGKIISGTYMEKANGIDRDSTSSNDVEKFNQISPSKMENSLSLKKDLANLQIVDWLIGNPDRLHRNMVYQGNHQRKHRYGLY